MQLLKKLVASPIIFHIAPKKSSRNKKSSYKRLEKIRMNLDFLP